MVTALTSIGRIERVTLAERVYAELRDLLMAGELAPGQKLSLRSIAETLGVSMMPVREAVTRLAADQALKVLPNRAVSVPLMTRAQFQDLTTVRSAIESFAAEQAALRRSEASLAATRELHNAFRSEAESPRPQLDQAVRINKEFHFAIYHATGLPPLVSIIVGLWLKIGPVLNFDRKRSEDLLPHGGAADHHARLVEAIVARNSEAARQALVDDIAGAAAFVESTGRLPL